MIQHVCTCGKKVFDLTKIFIHFADDWASKWVQSTHKGAEAGKFEWTAGKFYGDADKDKVFFLVKLKIVFGTQILLN